MKKMIKSAMVNFETELRVAKSINDKKAIRVAEVKIERATKALEREYDMELWEV